MIDGKSPANNAKVSRSAPTDTLSALAEAATWPWATFNRFAAVSDAGNGSSAEFYGDNPAENAAYFVSLVNAAPALIARVRKAEAALTVERIAEAMRALAERPDRPIVISWAGGGAEFRRSITETEMCAALLAALDAPADVTPEQP
jgi:hypothetical protein